MGQISILGRVAPAILAVLLSLTAAAAGRDVSVLGPSPAPLARIKGRARWHVLLKGASAAPLPEIIAGALAAVPARGDVSFAPDVDPLDMM